MLKDSIPECELESGVRSQISRWLMDPVLLVPGSSALPSRCHNMAEHGLWDKLPGIQIPDSDLRPCPMSDRGLSVTGPPELLTHKSYVLWLLQGIDLLSCHLPFLLDTL